jgi:uncharacterized membrane protein YoaK (UPF0700 family)
MRRPKVRCGVAMAPAMAGRTNRTMRMFRDLARTVLLCLVGGSADGIFFLRYATFVGAMSGNTILLGIDIAQWQPERAFYHFAIVAVFLIAAVFSRVMITSRIPVIGPLMCTR